MFPATGKESERDLLERLAGARRRIDLFGLTRNFFTRTDVGDLLVQKAAHVPVRMYLMDPASPARVEHYRVEPVEAAFADPERTVRDVVEPLRRLQERAASAGPDPEAGLRVYTFSFPCSFAIEQIDDVCRVLLYGHGVRGSESPIMVFSAGTRYHDFFAGQIRWLENLAANPDAAPWAARGARVERLAAEDRATPTPTD
jgi:hypothetical protein